MKLGLITAALFLSVVGCASAPPPKAVEAPIHNASAEDCQHVYERVLSIMLVETLDQEQLFSKEAVQTAGVMLDQVYTKSGKKQRLFQICTRDFNVEQAKCMTEANTLEEMDLCGQLLQTKKHP